jgi:hypothetical protein
MAEIVPATQAMIDKLYGKPIPRTARAIAVVEGGEVLGVGGVYVEGGRQVVFAGMTDAARSDLRKHTKVLLRAARDVMDIAAQRRLQIFALADPQVPKSREFLEHLGFEQYSEDTFRYG